MKQQRGISLSVAVIVLFGFGVLLLVFMKIMPAFVEHSTIRRFINDIAAQSINKTPSQLSGEWGTKTIVEEVNSVKFSDFKLIRKGQKYAIAYDYDYEIFNLSANSKLVINFHGESE